jgi:beta-lactamase regulating signal transducer with metallopeptidase domain
METIDRYLLTFLLNASWQIPLVTAVAWLATWVMRKGPAAHKHVVWAAALAASVVLPLASLRNAAPEREMEIVVEYSATTVVQPAAPVPASTGRSHSSAGNRSVDFARTTATIILGAYVLFVLFRAVKLMLLLRTTAEIVRSARSQPVSGSVEAVWVRSLRAFGLSNVELLSSKVVTGPVTAGVLRRSIILPDQLLETGSEDVLLTAIGHEMAHVARRDFAMNLLYEILYLPVCFHPAAWILRRGVDRTRELACDELVVHRVLDADVYARSIVSIATTMVTPVRSGAALGVFDGDILEERIRRLVEPPASWKHARALLATGLGALAICAVLGSSVAMKARAQGGASEEMQAACSAYNDGDFANAVQHFENAVRLAPASLDAKMFLANALMKLFFATKASPTSPLLASARKQYEAVLATDPRNKQALRGMVAIAMESRNLEEAREWAMKQVQLDPADKTAYYTVGVMDWTIVYPEFLRAGKKDADGKMREYTIPDAAHRKALRERYSASLDQGFQMLQTAIQLDPMYDDAMAYLNLLCRLKSGFADSAAESADLLAKADEWVRKALAAKRQRPPATNAKLDVNGPAPGPPSAHAIVQAPPPPPPPNRPAPGR